MKGLNQPADKRVLKKTFIWILALTAVWFGIKWTADLVEWLRIPPEQVQATQTTPIVKTNPDETTTTDTLYIEINKTRTKNGLQAFSRNMQLDKSAALKCNDMVEGDYYAHDNPSTGKKGYTYISDVGVRFDYASENLNDGWFNKTSDVIDSWMSSPSHAASILDPQFTEIGFAVCTNPKTPLRLTVVQHKINPLEQAVTQPSVAPVQRYQAPSTTTCKSTTSEYIAPETTCVSR